MKILIHNQENYTNATLLLMKILKGLLILLKKEIIILQLQCC